MQRENHIFENDSNSDHIDWEKVFTDKIWVQQLMELSGLSQMQKHILHEYFFLGKTEKEIGEGIPSQQGDGTITSQRVSKLKEDALEKIRQYLIKNDKVSKKRFEENIISKLNQ